MLPESIFGNPTHGYVVQWLQARLSVTAVVSMPEPLFKTSGKGGTHTKVHILIGTLSDRAATPALFMGEANGIGSAALEEHDA